jgi:ADP-heptose:LPS heptosyltransferase
MDETPKSFVLIRHLMRGDTLLCSAVVKAVHERNPGCKIYFQTKFPEVFENNPRVVEAGLGVIGPNKPTAIYNLNLVYYEQMPGWHLIDGFAQGAGFKRGEIARDLEMFPRVGHYDWAKREIHCSDYVVIAPGPGLWEGRNWKEERWRALCQILINEGRHVVIVGQEMNYKLPCSIDLRGKTQTFLHLGAVIGAASLFVGIDSFPCHVAGAMKTPRVVLFGVTSPQCLLCNSPHTSAVVSDSKHPFTGLRHKVNSMNKINLGNPPNNPMDTISVEEVLKTIRSHLCRPHDDSSLDQDTATSQRPLSLQSSSAKLG